jgi:hypothetical protein
LVEDGCEAKLAIFVDTRVRARKRARGFAEAFDRQGRSPSPDMPVDLSGSHLIRF